MGQPRRSRLLLLLLVLLLLLLWDSWHQFLANHQEAAATTNQTKAAPTTNQSEATMGSGQPVWLWIDMPNM